MQQIVLVVIGIVIILFIVLTFVIAMNFSKSGREDEEAAASKKAVRVSLQREHAALEARRDRGELTAEQFAKKEGELAQRLLDEGGLPEAQHEPRKERSLVKLTAFALTILFPLTGAGLYLFYGDFSSLSSDAVTQIEATREAVKNQKTMAGVIMRLEEAVQKDPKNVSAWEILADHYVETRNLSQAQLAYEKLVELQPKDVHPLTKLIEVSVELDNGTISPHVFDLIKRAMVLDPNDGNLWLMAGFAYNEEGNYKEAVLYWHRLVSILPEKDQMRQALEFHIQEAMKTGNLKDYPDDPFLKEKQSGINKK